MVSNTGKKPLKLTTLAYSSLTPQQKNLLRKSKMVGLSSMRYNAKENARQKIKRATRRIMPNRPKKMLTKRLRELVDNGVLSNNDVKYVRKWIKHFTSMYSPKTNKNTIRSAAGSLLNFGFSNKRQLIAAGLIQNGYF